MTDTEVRLRDALEKSTVECEYLRAQLAEKTRIVHTLVSALWDIGIAANLRRDAEGARARIGEAMCWLESEPSIRLPVPREAQ